MKFIVDECTGAKVSQWLSERGHDVFCVYTQARGWKDKSILEKAVLDERIVITNDKDFGEMVFRDRHPHKGIILLRLSNTRWMTKIQVLDSLLQEYPNEQLADHFTVVTEKHIRISPPLS